MLTLEVERRYSKDQILELYLNQVPLGSSAYGVAEAANAYFAKEVGALTLEESGVLAAMIKAPSYYSPFGLHQEELLGRKDYVLSRMVDRKYISQEQANEAKSRSVQFAESSQGIEAPHFSLMVTDELITKYGEDFVRENGLSVFTTLDWDLQKEAEAAVQKFSEQNITYGAHNAALVTIDPRTGEILAMVGSRNWHGNSEPADCISGASCTFDPKLNVSTALPGRQPGSAFKPFVYAEAFLKGATEQTIVVDEPTNFGIWGDEEYKPQNYDGKFRGPVTLRDALAQSLNVPSVKVLADIAGLQDSIELAKRMGITTLTQDPSFYGLALVLGGGETRLLDMVSAYGVFANAGRRVSPFAIDRIEDSGGSVLEKRLIQAQGVLLPKSHRRLRTSFPTIKPGLPYSELTLRSIFRMPGLPQKQGQPKTTKTDGLSGTPQILFRECGSVITMEKKCARSPDPLLRVPCGINLWSMRFQKLGFERHHYVQIIFFFRALQDRGAVFPAQRKLHNVVFNGG
ncbi:MAG: Penicillin-binding protein, 1A family [Candidatus Giovannonibacteria bacterium GW2011_GWB1_47_6b]|uniref:peptidoglycan glycosyltransferase n=1 Tax=Candidatus Giovannonibacteria bacterium GW2011_GWB1_47_6b TaxID=1618655 RepID=A0A0G1VAX1_9BACT|nr:MAG: Penicillin-binding protein, 1A family [Candidatus Giovannonibacteria bacterium GW2011_GWB1_47_6b]